MFYNYVKKNVNIIGTAPGRISDYSDWKMGYNFTV